MERDLDDLISEGKMFRELKLKNKNAKFPTAGTPCYLISREWIKKYKKYILNDSIKRHQKPNIAPTHCNDTHPGVISNAEDLLEDSDKHLKGTGTLEHLEASVVDRYFKPNIKERYEFKIYNDELWKFLHEKYGGLEIKRFYTKMGQYYSQVDIFYKVIPVFLLKVEDLLEERGSGLIYQMLVDYRV
jgi:hypothetical protein